MVWWIFLPLGVWVWLQAQRIDALARRIAELELQLFNLRDGLPPITPSESQAAAAPQVEPELEPLLLTDVVLDDELLLDTPLPEASNDLVDAAPAPAPPAQPPRLVTPLLLDEPVPEPPRAEPERVAPPPKIKAPTWRFDRWLAENGLAWIAGIALALGGMYLVSFATQQAWFTPAVRLVCAIAFGAALLGSSEWTRRLNLRRPPGRPLVSSLFAGAGIAVLYGTIWLAYGTFHFVDWPAAAALLMLCALALVGLSLLHGEAFGVLAIAAALLAPPLTNSGSWPWWALTPYVGLAGAAGFGLAALRRWAWVAAVTLAGFYFWFFASIAADEVRRALALVSFASLGGLLLTWRLPVQDEDRAWLSWSQVHSIGPSIAISLSSALLIWAWLIVAPAPSGQIAGPALIAVFHVALAAYAVRARAAAPVALAIAIGALVIGFMAYLRARFFYGDLGSDFYPTVLFGAFTVAFSALGARPHRTGRVLITAAGAVAAALLTMLAASSRENWHSLAAWLPLFTGAAFLFAAAWRTEISAQDRKADAAIDWWAGAGAVLVLLGIESALPAEARTTGHAAVSLLFATGLVWRGWRPLGWASLAAAALSLGSALSPALIGGALAGSLSLWAALLIVAGAAALLFGASTLLRRNGGGANIVEALSAAAVIATLAGVFLALRWFAAGGAGVALDGFTETSLRVLALMAAGLTLLPRIHETPARIGAWRSHVLLGIGLIYVLLVPGLGINPWWGGPGRAVVYGPPLLNALALAYAAPAAFAFVAANRLYERQRLSARIYAVAGAVPALLWLVLEIRHSFHDAAMAAPQVGLFESACYALALLAFALALAIVARTRAARNLHRPFTQDLMHIMRGVAWASLGAAVLILMVLQHPIWGAQDSTTSNAFSTMLATLAQYLAVVLALMLGRALSVSKKHDPARFAAASAAVIFAWSAGHCVVRWLHHRGYMDDGAPLKGLEGLLHAVWPLLFVIVAAQLTRRAPGRDTVRAYLYDLQAIWAAAVWPALAFAGLGLWLLFNPWWGFWPAQANSAPTAGTALALYALAAALTNVSLDVPHVRWTKWLVPAATVACAVYLFVAATLIVRWLYHGADMSTATAGDVELWIYSAVWALFGAAALGLGSLRNDPMLHWIGLAALGTTIVKVFIIDAVRLSGIIRVASLLGLGAVLIIVAWLARRNRQPPSPGDLVTVKPSARRERRRVRRRTSP